MASPNSKRHSRKRRRSGAGPRAVPSTRREEREARQAVLRRELERGDRTLGREGERPEGLFGGLPVSELGILIGTIALIIGFFTGGGAVLIVGIAVLGLAVLEVTGREHFSGYRSHTTLLAAVPAVALESVIVLVFGAPRQRALLILFVLPVFAVLFWLLRRRFATARQARVAAAARGRPPRP